MGLPVAALLLPDATVVEGQRVSGVASEVASRVFEVLDGEYFTEDFFMGRFAELHEAFHTVSPLVFWEGDISPVGVEPSEHLDPKRSGRVR